MSAITRVILVPKYLARKLPYQNAKNVNIWSKNMMTVNVSFMQNVSKIHAPQLPLQLAMLVKFLDLTLTNVGVNQKSVKQKTVPISLLQIARTAKF